MPFLNETQVIAQIMTVGTNGVTGDLFLTILIIFFVLIMLGFTMRIPLEYMMIACVPLLITLMAYQTSWYGIGGIIFIGLAVIFAQNWWVQAR